MTTANVLAKVRHSGMKARPPLRVKMRLREMASMAGKEVGRLKWELSALLVPAALAAIATAAPEASLSPSFRATIGSVAAVQGALTGLSLIALIFAVELANDKESRDDSVYELMIGRSGIRPMYVFAITALLATLSLMALSDFSGSSFAPSTNQLWCAYLLTALVGIVLLFSVLRILATLRPRQIVEYRQLSNEQERRRRVEHFINTRPREISSFSEVERLVLPFRPLPAAETEKLFRGVNDAVREEEPASFEGALNQIRTLISNSAEQIMASGLPFQPPGRPELGYWYPLDAINDRLFPLWESALKQDGHEFSREMWSFGYWLVMTGIENRSGEMLEVGLRSGLASYSAASEAGKVAGHARREWMNLGSAGWWRVRRADQSNLVSELEAFTSRLIEHLQEYGNMLLVADDSASFVDVLREFNDAFFDREKRAWRMHLAGENRTGPLHSFEYAVLALLALGGRVMTLGHQGKLSDLTGCLEPIERLIAEISPMERFVPAAYEQERPLHQQWGWWELDGEGADDSGFRWMDSEQYILLPLLLHIVKSEASQPLPSPGGFAQRFIDAWDRHQGLVLDIAGVPTHDRDEVVARVSARIATAKAAEERETEDIHLAAQLDEGRVSRFLAKVKLERRKDRVVETCFGGSGRVHRVSEAEWGTTGRFAAGWLLPRSYFVGDVIAATYYAELDADGLVRGLENGIAVALVDQVGGRSPTVEAQSSALNDLLGAIDVALTGVGDGPQLIVFVGEWPVEVHSQLHWRMFDNDNDEIEAIERQHYQQRGAYKGHWILWFNTGGTPRIAVISLERWGSLVRAPVNGEDVGVGLEEIGQEEAQERAREKLSEDADEVALAEQVRREMLLVSAHIEERTRFEVDDPDAARIIHVSEQTEEDPQTEP